MTLTRAALAAAARVGEFSLHIRMYAACRTTAMTVDQIAERALLDRQAVNSYTGRK
jgi:hypothetical protein